VKQQLLDSFPIIPEVVAPEHEQFVAKLRLVLAADKEEQAEMFGVLAEAYGLEIRQ
jgi:hypothetical protein